MTSTLSLPGLLDTDWHRRLNLIVQTMREISAHTDPEAMVQNYGARIQELLPRDGQISLSRRGLIAPHYRITRASRWKHSINPWKQKELLPMFDRGLLGELLYAGEPRVIDDLSVDPEDPAYEHFEGMGSLMAIPMFDEGQALNMVVLLRRDREGFDCTSLPETVWMSNLFGRATKTLVLTDELKTAYEAVDRELRTVADIQRSLLPRELPRLDTLEMAAYYQTSRRAGGDYYDCFRIDHDRVGLLIADVAGHGTPAAVLMAVLHSLAHTYAGAMDQPAQFLTYLNQQLSERYTSESGTFVTAFYGVYDGRNRTLTYSNAGHNAPRVKHCATGRMSAIDQALSLPLGVADDARYESAIFQLSPGDQAIFYTDGITEAMSPTHDLFGVERLDAVLNECRPYASELIAAVLQAVDAFTENQPANDDRTIVVGRVM